MPQMPDTTRAVEELDEQIIADMEGRRVVVARRRRLVMIRWKLVGLQIVEEPDRAIDGKGDEIASGEFNEVGRAEDD